MQLERTGWEREYRPVTLLSLVVVTRAGITMAETDLYIQRRKDSYTHEVHTGEDVTRMRESLEAACRRGILFTKVEKDYRENNPGVISQQQTAQQRLVQQLATFMPTETDAEAAADMLQVEERNVIFQRHRPSQRS